MAGEGQPSWQELQDEAAEWLARMDSGSVDKAAFEAWRAADPRRAVAFAQIVSTTQMLDRTKPALKPKLDKPPARGLRNLLLGGGGVLAVAGVAGVSLFAVQSAKASATTAVGGRKTVSLPDDIILDLNTDTHVEWRKSATVEITLRRGEISVRVPATVQECLLIAPNSAVSMASGEVNARLRGEVLDLSVIKGRCTVRSRRASGLSARQTEVKAGEAALANDRQQRVRALPDTAIDQVTAWKSNELVFHGQTLEAAVNEYNRYLDRKMSIADPSLSGLSLGGRFTTRDPKAFLAALKDGFGVVALDDGKGTVVLTK
ncbi:DUF4880 domain-containing protein [Asticcacaulis sp. YBE204]|uniref:FecR family protein n=1 Tax=Asticcacaulis sp. YBE204 TaxID=1282363 RepID=UPI0003C3E8AC|nr:DUF4880 domain-containing protein [Asticcacaulis sp. YBE204]ESQ79304.1 hypothetical protein AEYBE204_09855 [Asticcacaulis sp. YBE204]